MVDVSMRRDEDNLGLHSVELSLDSAYQIFEKLLMGEVGTGMISMLNEDVSSANILIVNVNKRSHQNDSLWLFFPCNL